MPFPFPACADMMSRRFCYLAVLLGAILYFFASGEWISWILLETVLVLPWLSLIVSLPAIWQFSVSPTGADRLEMGASAELWLLGSCPLPLPPFRGDLRLRSCMTGTLQRYVPEKGVSTSHCGGYRITVERGKICDYLGIFSFPIRHTQEKILIIRPTPTAIHHPPDPEQAPAVRWKSKPSGGFSENHELRPYRPGDSISRIHWKLSAKAGAYMLREPVEPIRKPLLLILELSGTPEILDRKLGRLLWLGSFLLEREEPFRLQASTAQGILSFSISSEKELFSALDSLLCCGSTPSGSPDAPPGFRQYIIGGEKDEA